MTNLKYQKEDLIWEATRRNEGYKRLFKSDVDQNTKTALAIDFFALNFLADPTIGIDNIKENIASDADPKEAHPYHGFFERYRKPVTYHQIPLSVFQYWDELYRLEQEGTDNSTTLKEQFATWFQPFLNQTSGRILISVDPECSDKEIFAGITEIKRKVVREKKAIGEDKRFSPRAYFPRNIGEYIGWLRMYDEIIETARSKGSKLTTDGAIVLLPDSFSFVEMWPVRMEKNEYEFEGIRRKYRDAYREATDLIKISPYISFSNSRAQK
jgi:hypothetical protein